MEWVKRLSIGRAVSEPLEDKVVLGLNQVGWGEFEVTAGAFPDLRPNAACRLYVGRSDKFTVLLLQGLVSKIEEVRDGVQRITVRQRSQALEKHGDLDLTDCTAVDVLQEIIEISGLTFSTAAPSDPRNGYLTRKVPAFSHRGPLTEALARLGTVSGIPDAIWYEQPDGRVFWGSWSQTPVAQTPLPLQGNVIQEQDPSGRAVYIPVVGAIRPGMLMNAPTGTFRVDELQLLGDRMRLEWSAAKV